MIRRILRSTAIGALVGVGVALLLHIVILNTPVQIPPQRFGWQVFSLGLAGAIAGLALSSVIALQASNPDPAYPRRRPPRKGPPRGPNQP
ncbi:MAG: hypothetical protein ACKO8I_16510 [Cyanobacteriota bacterium]